MQRVDIKLQNENHSGVNKLVACLPQFSFHPFSNNSIPQASLQSIRSSHLSHNK